MVSSTSKPSSQQLLCLGSEGCNMSTARKTLGILIVFCCALAPVHAQKADVAQFFAGAALGLGLHESGHLILDAAFGADPGVRKISAGFIPFFAITHHPVSRVREFAISSAGFWVQHGTSEILLTRRPDLRHEHAPIAK